MKRFICVLGAGAGDSIARAAAAIKADCPQYMTLQQSPYGYGRPVQAQAYSYGWFGVPRRHARRHFSLGLLQPFLDLVVVEAAGRR